MNHRLLVPRKTPGLLDLVPGAAAAYSLRNLSLNYTGPVVTVRRSTDSAEADFTASEVSDGTLAAWCMGGDGYVKTWHDQSQNGRDATQTTTGYQPQLIDAGALITEGGKAAVQFDGVDDKIDVVGYKPSGTVAAFGIFTYASLAATATPFSCHKTGSPSGGFSCFNYTPGPTKISFQTGLGGTWVDGVNELALGDFDFNPTLVAFQIRSAGTTMHIRGASILDSAKGLIAAGNDLRIGGNAVSPASNPFSGTWQELIIYPTDMTSLRQRIEGNLAWTYNA